MTSRDRTRTKIIQRRAWPIAVLLISLVCVFLMRSTQQAHAQVSLSEQILEQLAMNTGMEIVRWDRFESPPGSSAYLRSPGSSMEYTNTASVFDISSQYGANGGSAWVEAEMANWPEGCQRSQQSFHGYPAYYITCQNDELFMEAFQWGMDSWGLRTFNFLRNPDMSAMDLAEQLYMVMLSMMGSSDTPTFPPDGATQSSGSEISAGEDLPMKAVEMLAHRLGVTNSSDYDYQYNVFGLLGFAYRSPGIWGDYSEEFSIDIYRYNPGDPINEYHYCWDASYSNSNITDVHGSTFHGMPAFNCDQSLWQEEYNEILEPTGEILYTDTTTFLWSNEIWIFKVGRSQGRGVPSGYIQLENVIETLYEISVELGMAHAEGSLGSLPTIKPPAISNTTTTTAAIALTGALAGTALIALAGSLPPFQLGGRFGPQANIEAPEGKVLSPVPGRGYVDPNVAAYHQDLLNKGYVYDSANRKFKLPPVASPVDGSMVPASQASWERAQLARGLQYDPASQGFYEPQWFVDRERNWVEFNQRLDERHAREMVREQVRQRAIRMKRAEVSELEEQAQRDYQDAFEIEHSDIKAAWRAVQITSRELCTARNADGEVTLKSIAKTAGVRLALAKIFGGSTELLFTSGDWAYRTYDGIMQGKSIARSASESAGWMFVEYYAIYTGVAWGGKALRMAAGSKPAMWMGSKVRSAGRMVTNKLPGKAIKPKLQSLKDAVGDGISGQTDPNQVRQLYQNRGMKSLRELEKSGHITPDQARALNQSVTQSVNETIDAATPQAMREFEKQTGVKIKEVMVGDSGSSARVGAARSVKTDADRAIMATFDDATFNNRVRQMMAENPALNEAQARQAMQEQLQSQFSRTHQQHVADALNKPDMPSLELDDVGYQNYSGVSGDPGVADSYSANFNRARMQQGNVKVYQQKPNGQITTHRASGQAMLDQEALTAAKQAGASSEEAAKIIESMQPKFDLPDAQNMLVRQQQAVANSSDPHTVAKAVARTDKALRISSPKPGDLPQLDKKLVQEARHLLSNPQTAKPGQSFVQQAQSQIQDIFKAPVP